MGVLDGSGLDAQKLLANGHGGIPGLCVLGADEPLASLSTPIGVITAAVPQAKTSVISPEATPSRHSSRVILRSVTSRPMSLATWLTDIRVAPSRMVPLRAGVTRERSFMTKKTFMPPSSSTASSLKWARNSTCLQPFASASCWCDQGSCVVAAALGCTGSAATCTGVFAGDPDGDGLELAAEVVPGRGGDDAEGHFPGSTHTEERLRGDHEGTQVEGFAIAGRNPLLVSLHEFADGAQEVFLRSSGRARRRADLFKRAALASGRKVQTEPSA